MIGKTVSHYRITAKLGEGGMGAVYRAEDHNLQRAVALKFLPADLVANPRARERMLREARAASCLNHPNIATIYEVGEHDGVPFIAMELVSGESLKQALLRGALPASQLLDVARQIAEGLNEAHQAGVLHRDIKPANVMLDPRGRVKLLDFGVAQFLDRERDANETAESFASRTAGAWGTGGTIPYMSPEQLRGETMDARSDIFSFGVLLFECLTGRLPFRGETTIDISHAILHEPPASLRSSLPEISSEWEQLVERCLEKEPGRRFASVREVLAALRRAATPVTVAEKSVAVLYFENLSRDKEDEYFRDGITEDVITELSKIKPLRVFPRSAVLAYRDKPATAPEVGRHLHAAYVLGGSVRRAGNRLRITAQLVETRSGHTAWAERYDREMEDVFEVQDDIARNISQALRITLSPQEEKAIGRKPTDNPQAYDYYLRGRQFFHMQSRNGHNEARQLFARAIVLDARYARAYAGVADCCSFLYMYHEASETNLREAETASRRAVELDPDSAEAHASRGLALSLNKRFEEAGQEFETAIRLNPNLFEAYYFYARTRFAEGRMEEAARLFEQAGQVNAEDYQVPSLLSMVYRSLGRVDDMNATQRRALALIGKHLELHPDDARALYFGAGAACALGEKTRGLQWARRALEIDPNDTSTLYNVACVYSLEGLIEESIECLEKAVERGFGQKEWIEHDSDLDAVRSHPRYQALLSRLKL